MSHSKKSFGLTMQGVESYLYTIGNEGGFQASVADYGATLTELTIPISEGRSIDVILGFDRLSGYLKDDSYLGSTIGRVASRISNGEFELDGIKYFLDKNEGEHHLHGGANGFNNQLWEECSADKAENSTVRFCHESPDGENGYPGNVQVTVEYTIIKDGLRIDYRAETDKPTPINMTAHPYFNLNGNGQDISGHNLKIFSHQILEFDDKLIPTGNILDISGSNVDFTDFSSINGRTSGGAASDFPVEYDHFYELYSRKGELSVCAIAKSESTGLELEIATTQPGLQFYSGDYIPKGTVGKRGSTYGPRSGFCLEPEGYPDAPNHPNFPSVILHPGEAYVHSTEYRFRELNALN